MGYSIVFFVSCCIVGAMTGFIVKTKHKVTWGSVKWIVFGYFFVILFVTITLSIPMSVNFPHTSDSFDTTTTRFLITSMFYGMIIGWCISMLNYKRILDKLRRKKPSPENNAGVDSGNENLDANS